MCGRVNKRESACRPEPRPSISAPRGRRLPVPHSPWPPQAFWGLAHSRCSTNVAPRRATDRLPTARPFLEGVSLPEHLVCSTRFLTSHLDTVGLRAGRLYSRKDRRQTRRPGPAGMGRGHQHPGPRRLSGRSQLSAPADVIPSDRYGPGAGVGRATQQGLRQNPFFLCVSA